MKWVNGACQISADLIAEVWRPFGELPWCADILAGEHCIWTSGDMPTEEAAKAAVCHWIGKTMAQFSNALAEGCPQVDEE